MHKIDLPRPISVNNLHANVEGKGRISSERYNTWKWQALAMLQKQKPLPQFTEPVRILYAVGEVGVSANFDLGNAEKALTDALVEHGVIPDDRRKYVRGISLEWIESKDGVTAYIGPAGKFMAAEIPLVRTIFRW